VKMWILSFDHHSTMSQQGKEEVMTISSISFEINYIDHLEMLNFINMGLQVAEWTKVAVCCVQCFTVLLKLCTW